VAHAAGRNPRPDGNVLAHRSVATPRCGSPGSAPRRWRSRGC
jgi:hypothetical protein